jgi:hypothetical protein
MDGGGLCMVVAKARCNGEMLVFSNGRLIKVALMGPVEVCKSIDKMVSSR